METACRLPISLHGDWFIYIS